MSPDDDSGGLLAWLDSIDFDAAWDGAIADLRAEGIDTDNLVRDAADNLRFWQSVPLDSLLREAEK